LLFGKLLYNEARDRRCAMEKRLIRILMDAITVVVVVCGIIALFWGFIH
jgi:hypothetical protein